VAYFHANAVMRYSNKLTAFQSLKRDVAYFHVVYSSSNHRCQRVSIAQARCGLLPLSISLPMSSHPCMVSIAQARCGLLPLESVTRILSVLPGFNRSSAMWPTSTKEVDGYVAFHAPVSIAQARCGLLPRIGHVCPVCLIDRFNRSSAMWPTSTSFSYSQFLMSLRFQSLKRDVAYFHS